MRSAILLGLVLSVTAACTGPGSQPYGSTNELEQRKLHDLQTSPAPPAIIGGLDADVQQLAYITDNAASVSFSLTRQHTTDTDRAFAGAVRVAKQNGAVFTSVLCSGGQVGAQGRIAIAAGSASAPGWVATLLLSSFRGSLQVKLDIPGGTILATTVAEGEIMFGDGCGPQTRRAFA